MSSTEYEYATRHTDELDLLTEGDVLEYPEEYGGDRLELIEVDRQEYTYGPTTIEAVAQKDDGSTVELREYHLESALDLATVVEGGDDR